MAVFNTISTLSNPTSLTTGEDSSAPFSFQDWKARNNNITPGDQAKQYDAYLRNWYATRTVQNTAALTYVKTYYKTFLQSLGIAPRTAAEQELFGYVDFSRDVSIQAAIAGYARRLKDIAVYISNKRNDIYYSKLKNNLTGTGTSLERMFYSYLLTAFTRKLSPDGIISTSFVIADPDILTSLPYLSTINNSFNIQIEEIYDTTNYFDQDPTVDVSTYTSIASAIPKALYASSNYTIPEDYIIQSIVATVVTVAATTSSSTTSTATNPVNTYFTFLGDGTTTTFSTPGITSGDAALYQVSISGVVQTPYSSYVLSVLNQNIVFAGPVPYNDIIVVVERY